MVQKFANMREYEMIYVLKPNLDDKVAKEFMLKIKNLIKNLGGKNIKVDCWGRKKLAWECKKHQRGIYVHHTYIGPCTIVYELEHLLNIDESILLRQIMILNKKIDENIKIEKDDNLEISIARERKEISRQSYNFDSNFDPSLHHNNKNMRNNGERY